MRRFLIHLLLVTIFLLIPVLSSPDLDGSFSMLRIPMFQREMLQMILLIGFFYLNFLFLIPKFFNRKNYFLYAVLVGICFFLTAFLPQILISGGSVPPDIGRNFPGAPHPPDKFGMVIFKSFLPFSFAFLSSFFWFKSIEQRDLERAKSKAELLNLKYQLQPHFLFNILNSIYSLTLMKSDDAPEGILKLSNVMRYVVQESGEDWVDLSKEIAYLKDYIALQLIRTDNSLEFSYTETGDPGNLKIAPLILVNFVENAFKFGFNPEENSKISMNLQIEDSVLKLKVFNKIVNRSLAEKDSTRVGLKNTLERLQQIYPDQHEIHITNDGKVYEVDLKIRLKN